LHGIYNIILYAFIFIICIDALYCKCTYIVYCSRDECNCCNVHDVCIILISRVKVQYHNVWLFIYLYMRIAYIPISQAILPHRDVAFTMKLLSTRCSARVYTVHENTTRNSLRYLDWPKLLYHYEFIIKTVNKQTYDAFKIICSVFDFILIRPISE